MKEMTYCMGLLKRAKGMKPKVYKDTLEVFGKWFEPARVLRMVKNVVRIPEKQK